MIVIRSTTLGLVKDNNIYYYLLRSLPTHLHETIIFQSCPTSIRRLMCSIGTYNVPLTPKCTVRQLLFVTYLLPWTKFNKWTIG